MCSPISSHYPPSSVPAPSQTIPHHPKPSQTIPNHPKPHSSHPKPHPHRAQPHPHPMPSYLTRSPRPLRQTTFSDNKQDSWIGSTFDPCQSSAPARSAVQAASTSPSAADAPALDTPSLALGTNFNYDCYSASSFYIASLCARSPMLARRIRNAQPWALWHEGPSHLARWPQSPGTMAPVTWHDFVPPLSPDFTMYTITSVGFGDIVPSNDVERAVSTVLLLMSSVLWGLVIATFSSTFATMNPDQRDFTNQAGGDWVACGEAGASWVGRAGWMGLQNSSIGSMPGTKGCAHALPPTAPLFGRLKLCSVSRRSSTS